MATIHHLSSKSGVEAAWEAYRAHAAQAFDNRSLLLDRDYMTVWAKLERRFKQLATMPETVG